MKRAATPGSATSAKVTPGTGGRAKRVKMTPEALQCKKVETALSEANIPAGALEALLGVVPHSLLVPKDERHEFQERAVDMVANVLEQIKAEKEKAIPTKQAESEAAKTARATSEVAMEKTKEELDGTQKTCKDSKLSLAEVARQFQQAKEALKEAQSKFELNAADASEATRKKSILEALLKEIPDLQSRAAEILEVQELMKKIAAHMEIDSTMMSAVSLSLAKAPEARGEFDAKVIKELEDKTIKEMAEVTEMEQKAAPAKAALEAEVKAAEAALQAAKDRQLASARAYDKAEKTTEAADEAFKAAKKALAESAKAMKKAAQDYDNAEALRDLFLEGAMKDFQSLRERLAPEPVPEATAEPEEDIGMQVEEAPAGAIEMPQPVAVVA